MEIKIKKCKFYGNKFHIDLMYKISQVKKNKLEILKR